MYRCEHLDKWLFIKSIKEDNIMGAPEPTVGVITEQGDLGLGFDQLNEKDATAYAEATEKPKKGGRKSKKQDTEE